MRGQGRHEDAEMRGHRETRRRGEAEMGNVEVHGLSAVKWLRPKVEPENSQLTGKIEFEREGFEGGNSANHL